MRLLIIYLSITVGLSFLSNVLLSNDNCFVDDSISFDCDLFLTDSSYFITYSDKCISSLHKDQALSISLARSFISCYEQKKYNSAPWQNAKFAKFYYFVSNYDKSTNYYLKAVDYHLSVNDSSVLSTLYYSIGLNYLHKCQYVKSLEYLQISYNYADILNQSNIIAPIYLMSTCYLQLDDFEKSSELLHKGLKLSEEKNEEFYLQYIYNDLSHLEKRRGNLSIALDYALKAEGYANKQKDNYKLAHVQVYLGSIYKELKEYDKALLNLYKGYAEVKRRQDLFTLSAVCSDLGKVYLELNKLDSAELYFNERMRIVKNLKQDQLIAYAYSDLRRLMVKRKDYKLALEYLKRYKQYDERNYQNEEINNFGELHASFELKNKEKELEYQENQNRLNSLLLKKRKYLSVGLSFVLFLFVGLLIMIQRKVRIYNEQKEIEIKQQFLRFQMNPHFIFNTLNSIQYFIYKNNKRESSHYLVKFGRLMKMVLDNSKCGMVKLKEELDTLELYLELEKLRFDEKFNYTIKVDENIDILENRIPPMLIQPFIENSIIHGIMPKDGLGILNIELALKSDKIICIVEDNGVGRERAMEIKTESLHKSKSLGTKITESRLQLIDVLYKKSLKILYTDLRDEFEKPKGTRVEISFPFIN